MTFAQAAQKAIELGGKYDGHEVPEPTSTPSRSARSTALAGQGLIGVARDNYPRDGAAHSFVAGFAEVEVDVETGAYQILDFTAVADVGTVHQPAEPAGPDLRRRRCWASATRIGQKWVYDQHYGVPLAKRFHHNKPPTILDVPADMQVGRGRTFPIRRRRSARAASASRRSAPAAAPS